MGLMKPHIQKLYDEAYQKGRLEALAEVLELWENLSVRGRTEFDQVIMDIPKIKGQKNEFLC